MMVVGRRRTRVLSDRGADAGTYPGHSGSLSTTLLRLPLDEGLTPRRRWRMQHLRAARVRKSSKALEPLFGLL